MTKQDYLSQFGHLQSWIRNDRDSLKIMQAAIADIHMPEIHPDHVQVSPSGEAPYARTLESIEKLKARVAFEDELLLRLRAEILEITEVLDPLEKNLILNRYICCRPWDRIISDSRMNRATIFRWHKQALENLVLPENAIDISAETAGLGKANEI